MTTKITSLVHKVIAEMESKGKVKILSRENTREIEEGLAKGLAPIKKEFQKKERASRAYAKTLEEKLLIT